MASTRARLSSTYSLATQMSTRAAAPKQKNATPRSIPVSKAYDETDVIGTKNGRARCAAPTGNRFFSKAGNQSLLKVRTVRLGR
jgi:hypothetical protein